MKVLKRNQIIVLVIALMLVSAGYLNYTASNGDAISTSTDGLENVQYAGIGDAKLVNGNVVEDDNNEVVDSSISSINLNEENSGLVDNDNITNETLETSSNNAKQDDSEYFSASRLSRDTMYSQMLESYKKILESDTISSDQKGIAQTEIKNINDIKNQIMISENLIKTKEGIEDIVIFVNDNSVSVVVKSNELGQEQIAQIQNIIAREMTVDISNIHISSK